MATEAAAASHTAAAGRRENWWWIQWWIRRTCGDGVLSAYLTGEGSLVVDLYDIQLLPGPIRAGATSSALDPLDARASRGRWPHLALLHTPLHTCNLWATYKCSLSPVRSRTPFLTLCRERETCSLLGNNHVANLLGRSGLWTLEARRGTCLHSTHGRQRFASDLAERALSCLAASGNCCMLLLILL